MGLPIQKKASIRTERLELKPYSPADRERMIELLTNAEIAKTFMLPDFEKRERSAALAEKIIGFSRIGDTAHLEYGIYLDGRLIGFVNDCGIEGEEIEIGYVVHPDFHGKGYATEAVGAVLQELRGMGFRRVIAGYFVENTASRRVMEKCGMRPSSMTEEIEYRGAVHRCGYCEICFEA